MYSTLSNTQLAHLIVIIASLAWVLFSAKPLSEIMQVRAYHPTTGGTSILGSISLKTYDILSWDILSSY